MAVSKVQIRGVVVFRSPCCFYLPSLWVAPADMMTFRLRPLNKNLLEPLTIKTFHQHPTTT